MATPIVRVWLGDAGTGVLIGSTYDGSADSIALLEPITLLNQQYLTIQFIGGDAGETATAYLYGTNKVI